jgi:5-methylcytosine-specific restriction endonuclease McrA
MAFNRRPRDVKLPSREEADALLKRMRGEVDSNSNYRSKSLKIHGSVCAKCGREFDASNIHLLTVHHRDGNHHNNPPDGSNWENLCSHCHDDEHSRDLLGNYLGS